MPLNRSINGQDRTEYERPNEHPEASTGPDELVQSEVPSVTRGMGEATVEWKIIPVITNDKWIENLNRAREGFSG